MKFAALATIAVASIATLANADVCPDGELEKLLQLAFEPRLEECQNDSSFTFIPPSGVPDDDQVLLMCASEACQVTLGTLASLQPADCDLTFSNGQTLNVKRLLDGLVPSCKGRRSLRQ